MEKSKKKTKWDASIMIAIVAVLISLGSAYISLKESQIMLKQQQILSEQQEASVWPYLENAQNNTFSGDTVVLFEYIVTNKGVGPAIIDDVEYLFDGTTIKGWGLGEAMQKKHPNLNVNQLGNAVLDGNVLAQGESHRVISVQLKKSAKDSTDLSYLINGLDYQLKYCYCSVYGKCWRVESYDEISVSTECKFRENIR